jgi:hypothetical protein
VLWRNQLAAGIEVGGITLAATENDQAAFTRLLTLLREVESLQPDETARAAFLALAPDGRIGAAASPDTNFDFAVATPGKIEIRRAIEIPA